LCRFPDLDLSLLEERTMLPIRTILHPTDFSERSGSALRLACALTRDYGARLVVLHVATPPDVIYSEGALPLDPEVFYREAKERLDRLEVPEGNVRAERRFEEGDPATEILRVAPEVNADLIVMGTHGRTGLGRLLMGSVAEQIVRKASCPVLTVKTPFAPAPAPGAPHEGSLSVTGVP
jgi:nucleotide-binding universal stress UspA family protein